MPSTKPRVCLNSACFAVEVADTPQARSLGLMFRESMEKERGMLFIFEQEGHYPFWMKNTLIPLDIIWIDSNLSVVRVITALPCEAEPCPVYDPQTIARYVLEVNAGLAEAYGIREGDKASLMLS